ncbi:PduL/EutD family phosphate acyltransferase, partial [Clostridioides difficile]|uniref:PduL/EutD family phosphate acyltransferase n=1 Tax=Clostridioides difficile TaxID=1496 RepID=UPI003AB21B17
EPYVNPSSVRFEAVKELNDSGIFCGILLTPMLPFLTDNKDEISLADGFPLGVKAPIKESGDIAGTPGVKLEGTAGEVEMKEG